MFSFIVASSRIRTHFVCMLKQVHFLVEFSLSLSLFFSFYDFGITCYKTEVQKFITIAFIRYCPTTSQISSGFLSLGIITKANFSGVQHIFIIIIKKYYAQKLVPDKYRLKLLSEKAQLFSHFKNVL